MIPSARRTVPPVVIIIFTRCLFCFAIFWGKWGRTYGHRDGNLCKNKDHYRPGLWVGRVDPFQAKTMFATGETMGMAEWIIDDT